MSLTEAFGRNLLCKYSGMQTVLPFGEMGGRRGPNWYHWVAAGQSYLLLQTVFGKTYRIATIRMLQTDDRRTQHRAISVTVSTVG